jgi:tyrosyl-tRNA synthetase
MNPMLCGLTGGKMSASEPCSKIDCLESPDVVIKKISNMQCEDGEVAKNGILGILKMILMPISRLRVEKIQCKGEEEEASGDQRPFSSEYAPEGTLFTIDIRADTKDGVVHRHYRSYEEVEQDYKEKKRNLEELKGPVAMAINQLLARIRMSYESNEDWRAVEKLAYPEPEE